MIYRKWSLLTGPPAILGAIVGTVLVIDLLFVKHGPVSLSDKKKETSSSSK